MYITDMEKKAFDLDAMVHILRDAVKPYPKAAMFELADDGYASLFHQLVGCVISIRTKDEVTVQEARRLFGAAPGPEALSRLSEDQIDGLISRSTFHRNKARTIRKIAEEAAARGGDLPCRKEVLTAFSGVGEKCAHLALGVACGEQLVSVDVHVHRVTNRWGLVSTSTPQRTGASLGSILPDRYKVEINALLVPFGKHVCTGSLPHCSRCPLLPYCRQVGVGKHR